jgi:hypothetical protein
MPSIAGRNSNTGFFSKRHNHWASLLIHPNGLQLLKYYSEQLKNNPVPQEAAKLRQLLLHGSEMDVWKEEETAISIKLRKNLQELSFDSDTSVTGERDEEVSGALDEETASGNPHIGIRMNKSVVMIIEVSVDKNGGEKKAGQAFDYSSSIDPPKNRTILLLTLHFNRNQKECAPEITLEAFLYLHSETEAEQKLGFLWREVYPVLESVCEGLVRCLYCAKYLCALDTPENNWDAVSDNVAIEKNQSVYKIFDNRFHPTYRKSDVWMSDWPWLKRLNVESDFFLFEESASVNPLGRPSQSGDDSPETVSYPNGSVRIIRYDYVHGTHFASKVSHFLHIARRIEEMHAAGIVHGDVRGFNMLHPMPPEPSGAPGEQQTIGESLLIDLSGFETDKYPPGYSGKKSLTTNFIGLAKQTKNEEGSRLVRPRLPYCIPDVLLSDPPNKAWSALCNHFRKSTVAFSKLAW